MDLLRPLRVFDRRQQTHRWLAIPIAVLKKFSDDGAGSLAAVLAYYAFFSIFPLLLVFVTILGFVFAGDPSAQKSITNSVLGHIPVIGADAQTRQLHGRVLSLVIGVLVSLWAGLGITQAAQNAFDTVWAVPRKDRPDFLRRRLRGFALVAALGVMFLVSSALSGLVIGGLGGVLTAIAGVVVSLALNAALFAVAFRLLTSATVPTRRLWIGVVVAAVVWELLQLLGGYYVKHVLGHASNAYGALGTVLGLLAWLHLGAQLTLYAAEINVVLARRLWPRSLLDPPAAADERTLRALAKVEERNDREKIDVRFQN